MTIKRRALSVFMAGVFGAATITMTTSGPASAWLSIGKTTVHPAEGGTWSYGFWDAKVRSYYYHSRVTHGSTVVYNGERAQSVCTAVGYTSSATKWALNLPGTSDDYYYRVC
jgi:hypothetical protein